MKYDVKRREYDVIVIGEEPYLAYNRVGLTSFFQHRKVENLYLNPEDWVRNLVPDIKPTISDSDTPTVRWNAQRLPQLPHKHNCHGDSPGPKGRHDVRRQDCPL